MAPLANGSVAATTAPVQGKFWVKLDRDRYAWDEHEPDDNYVRTQEMRDRNGEAYPVYVVRALHEDRIQTCMRRIEDVLWNQRRDVGIKPDRDDRDLACWNWALTGLTGNGVAPHPVFGYVRMQDPTHALRPAYPTDQHYFDAVPAREGREWIRANAPRLQDVYREHQAALQWDIPKHADRSAVERLARMIIEANGFEVREQRTPYEVCVQYTVGHGLVWDHWWIRVNERYTFETLPDMRGIQISGTEQLVPREKDVLRFYVRTIKPEHVDRIEKTLDDACTPAPHAP